MSFTPYPKGAGFRLDCYGTDAVPHRLRVYLDKFRKDAPFIPAPQVAAVEPPRTSRAKELLARAARLAGEEKIAA